MTYLERFKTRMAALGAAYTEGPAKPNRPLKDMPARDVPVVNALVDVIIGCQMKGQSFDALVTIAQAWADYEWQMVEPVVAAAKAARTPVEQWGDREGTEVAA